MTNDQSPTTPAIGPETLDTPESNGTQSAADESSSPERLVPVSEARKYRKRAQQAEQQLRALQREVQEHETRLREREEMIRDLDQARAIDAALIESNVIDLEAARLLAELELADADEPTVDDAIDELKRRRPYLFTSHSSAPRSSGAQSPAHEPAAPDETNRSANEAASTGRREDLLRYLRLRRKHA